MGIKISEQLKRDSITDPTKESKPVSLLNLCKAIENGNLTLPIFQTSIRWNIDKCISLLNFQLSGKAAVSPISINIINKKEIGVPQVTFIDRRLISTDEIQGKESVNDGQQRLTCNYMVYTNNEKMKNVVLDISKGKFLLNSGDIKKNQIPAGILYNKSDEVFSNYLLDHKSLQPFEVQNLLTKIRTKFMGYYYTVNYAKDLTESEQQEWFMVLNLAGSTIPETQVRLTEMLIKGVDYYQEYSNKFLERLNAEGLSNLIIVKATEISIPLACLNPAYEVLIKKEHATNFSPIPSDAKASAISKLEASEIRTIFSITLDAMENALSFIKNNNLPEPNRIDKITYLIGVFAYLGTSNLNSNQNDYLVNWYYNTDFTNKDNSEKRRMFEKLISVKSL